MQKTYIRRNWQNYPSTNTPLNETNLNAMDYSIDEVDSRVVELDTTKLDSVNAGNMITTVELNETSGIMKFTRYNGSSFTLQTAVGKIAVNFDYDTTTKKLILHHKDGTTLEIDLSELIDQTEFDTSDTIGFTVLPNGHIKADILNGSVTDAMLRPDYLADIRVVQGAALVSQQEAYKSEMNSEAWAVGTKDGQAVKTTDTQYNNNSKYYSDLALEKVDEAIEEVAEARELLDNASKKLSSITFWADLSTGHLYYETASDITFYVDVNTGHLMFNLT